MTIEVSGRLQTDQSMTPNDNQTGSTRINTEGDAMVTTTNPNLSDIDSDNDIEEDSESDTDNSNDNSSRSSQKSNKSRNQIFNPTDGGQLRTQIEEDVKDKIEGLQAIVEQLEGTEDIKGTVSGGEEKSRKTDQSVAKSWTGKESSKDRSAEGKGEDQESCSSDVVSVARGKDLDQESYKSELASVAEGKESEDSSDEDESENEAESKSGNSQADSTYKSQGSKSESRGSKSNSWHDSNNQNTPDNR